jgi:hypothetical protein
MNRDGTTMLHVKLAFAQASMFPIRWEEANSV